MYHSINGGTRMSRMSIFDRYWHAVERMTTIIGLCDISEDDMYRLIPLCIAMNKMETLVHYVEKEHIKLSLLKSDHAIFLNEWERSTFASKFISGQIVDKSVVVYCLMNGFDGQLFLKMFYNFLLVDVDRMIRAFIAMKKKNGFEDVLFLFRSLTSQKIPDQHLKRFHYAFVWKYAFKV